MGNTVKPVKSSTNPNDDSDPIKPNTWAGYLPETWMGGAQSLAQVGTGVWGLFNKPDLELKPYESTYEESGQLKGLADKAMIDAFAGGDDYASRIRARNIADESRRRVLEGSGGSRATILGNESAIADSENLANLGIDQQQNQLNAQKMSIAAQLQTAVMQDKANKSQDMRLATQSQLEARLKEIDAERENLKGSVQLITQGLSTASSLIKNEALFGEGGTMWDIMQRKQNLEKAKWGKKMGQQNTFDVPGSNSKMNNGYVFPLPDQSGNVIDI